MWSSVFPFFIIRISKSSTAGNSESIFILSLSVSCSHGVTAYLLSVWLSNWNRWLQPQFLLTLCSLAFNDLFISSTDLHLPMLGTSNLLTWYFAWVGWRSNQVQGSTVECWHYGATSFLNLGDGCHCQRWPPRVRPTDGLWSAHPTHPCTRSGVYTMLLGTNILYWAHTDQYYPGIRIFMN